MEEVPMSTRRYSPTVRRRRLASELRRLREERGLTIDQVAAEIDWHATKLSRFETGRRAIQPSDVRALIAVYDVRAPESDRLLTLAREARQRGWWHTYGEAVPDWFEAYVGLESEATSLRVYEAEFVPGLLQTEGYIRAVYRAGLIGDEDIEKRIAVRLARQQLLTGPEAPHLWAVVNEAAIRRMVGGPETMREQLLRLVETSELRNVTLQVLPFSVGAHAAMDGPFHVLGFGSGDPDVVYIEYTTGTLYLEKTPEVERYTLMFDHLRAAALPVEASRTLIAKIAAELE
ncbi:helix-turn-helix domain-containing protein [Streptosporangium sp. V21-05]|uniref:helix-turn-helix domain-containing protein n=1 Tax=Streptosporangium sp. V21-05 TaxID=3446115 RepID=UPI003F53B6D8